MIFFNKNFGISGLILLTCVLTCCQDNNPQKETLRITGSESMLNAFLKLKDDFESHVDTIEISIKGGGSRVGLSELANNETDLAMVSNDLRQRSMEQSGLRKEVIAYDAIIIIIHPSNVIKRLSNEEIREIYSGRITNWIQLGGNEGQIAPFRRNDNSGTHIFFRNYFMGNGEISDEIGVVNDNEEMKSLVQNNENAIGYISIGHYDLTLNGLEVESEIDSERFIAPTFYNVINGYYPLTRPLVVYYHAKPSQSIIEFINFVRSSKGQTTLALTGLIPPDNIIYD